MILAKYLQSEFRIVVQSPVVTLPSSPGQSTSPSHCQARGMQRPVLHRNSSVWQVEISPKQNDCIENKKVGSDVGIQLKSVRGKFVADGTRPRNPGH